MEEDSQSAHFSSRMDNLSDRDMDLAIKTSNKDEQIKVLQKQLEHQKSLTQ